MANSQRYENRERTGERDKEIKRKENGIKGDKEKREQRGKRKNDKKKG